MAEIGAAFPAELPAWACPPDPSHAFALEVIKEGVIIGSVPLAGRAVHLLGRQPDAVQTVLEHPSVSRVHAAILHRAGGELFLVDLGSTHGTLLNRKPLRPRALAPLPIGSVLRLGQSSRLLCVCGPPELLPPEHEPIRAHMPAPPPRAAAAAITAVAGAGAPIAPRAAGEFNWGQADDAAEEGSEGAEGGAGGEELEQLLRKADGSGLGRSERQAQLLDKLEKRRARLVHIEEEARRIEAKAGGGGGGEGGEGGEDEEGGAMGGLSAGQRAQLERCRASGEEHRRAAAELEGQLVDSLRRQLGLAAPHRPGAAGRGVSADGSESDGGSSGDDGGFFDRTARKRTSRNGAGAGGAALAGPAAPATAASLAAEREVLLAAERRAEFALLQLRAHGRPGGEGAEVGCLDPLDRFMAANEESVLGAQAAQAEARLADARARLAANGRLLALAAPAIDAAVPRHEEADAARGAGAPKRRALGAAPAPAGYRAGGDGAACDAGDAAPPPPSAAHASAGAMPWPPAGAGPREAAGAAAAAAEGAAAAAPARSAAARERESEWQAALSAMHAGGHGGREPAADLRGSGGPSAAPRHFEPARAFGGSRRGMVFQMGPRGLGYYEDLALRPAPEGGRPQRPAAAAQPAGASEQPPSGRGLGWAAAGAGGPSLAAAQLDEAALQGLYAKEREREAAVRPGLNAAQPSAVASASARAGSAGWPPAHASARDLPEASSGAGAAREEPPAWLPPEGQSGDGRTALNAKLGY